MWRPDARRSDSSRPDHWRPDPSRASWVIALVVAGLCLTPGRAASQGSAAADPATRRDAAQAGGPRWVVGLSGQFDDDSNDALLTTLDLGIRDATWLSFAAGRSRAKGPGVVADVLEAGVDHRFGLVGMSFSLERWGDSGDLETTDVVGSIYFQGERFRIGIEREERDIDVYYTLPPIFDRPDVLTAALSSNGTGVALRIGLAERWQLYGSWMDYDYSRNLALLPRIASLNLLSSSALTLANSFLGESAAAGLEWTWGERLLNFSVSRDESAIDGSRFRSFDAAFLFPVGLRMDLEINLGRMEADVASSELYGGVLLLIYGGG